MRLPPALLALLAALANAGCGGPPAAARRAEALLVAGDVVGAEALVAAELPRHPREPLLYRVRIGARLLSGDAAGAVAAYRELTTRLGSDESVTLRAFAIATLWQALASPSADARRAAVEAAVALDEEELADPVAALLADNDEVVRASAAAALLTAHPDAPEILALALASDEPAARALAVGALAARLGRHAAADLVAALDDPDASVRRAGVQALVRAGLHERAAALLALAQRDPSGPVRAAALRALADFGAHAEAALPAFADPFLGVRLAAVVLAARSTGAQPDERRAALDRAAAGPDLHLALAAATARARSGDRTTAASVLASALAAGDPTVRVAAAGAAADLVGTDAPRALAGLAVDVDPTVQLAAARALLALGRTDAALPVLTRVLLLAEDALRLDAALLLVRANGDRSPLEPLAHASSPLVRIAAVSALAATRGRVPAALLDALADPSPKVRVAAARGLAAR